MNIGADPTAIPQGSLELLETPVARKLLAAALPHIPAPGARRLAALRARPDVAVAIDTGTEPPQALLVRGKASVTEVDGVDPDYAVSARQYLGEKGARELLDMVDQPGTRMARITVRPAWVGLLDFAGGRLPGVMATADDRSGDG